MPFRPSRTVIFLVIAVFAWSSAPVASAQDARNSGQHILASSSVNQDGGLAVLSAALEFRHVPSETDCSHLVHEIYERAGFPYSYLTSRELFAGSPPFVRVKHPQPGDIIAWPGHAGIVVSPKGHTFYAAFSSGLGVERYNSDYWLRRGRPRFFRYMKAGTAIQTASSSARLPVKIFSDLDNDDPAPTRTPLAELQAAPPLPVNIVIASPARPTPLAVQQAALQHFARLAETLNAEDNVRLTQAVIVFDEFQVRKVRVKGSQGWAEIRINEPSSIIAGEVTLKKRTERNRWLLNRVASGSWEMTPPPRTIYLSRDAATRVLAHRLALLTEQSPKASSSEERAGIARVLAELLEGKR